ncbi:hypothetical protein ES703_25191 [subsurface metagenome]
MLKGKCPKCGYRSTGWALLNPEHQTCPNCGERLEIKEDSLNPPDDKKDSRDGKS